MQTEGYEYVDATRTPPNWRIMVRAAERAVDEGLEKARRTALLEAINSDRLQLKFRRSADSLPAPIRKCVDALKGYLVASCGAEFEHYQLQDCYALLTPAEEVSDEARAPQRWHLDAIKAFPVAALILRGRRATEFATGPYSDFSSGVSDRTLDVWTSSLKQINARTWESESIEEWEHFSRHLHDAGLVTGVDAQSGDSECDWSKLEVAPKPDASAGSAAIFWSNKVHRGPATSPGEERLVLFCSWLPRPDASSHGVGSCDAADGRAATLASKKESETDYSYYDGHLEPKLRLSERAIRSSKRRCL